MKKTKLLAALVILGLMGTLGIGAVNAETVVTPLEGEVVEYTLNLGFSTEQVFTAGVLEISDGKTKISILDRNLGAIQFGTGCHKKNYNCVPEGWREKNYNSYEECVQDGSQVYYQASGYTSWSDCVVAFGQNPEFQDESHICSSLMHNIYGYYNCEGDCCVLEDDWGNCLIPYTWENEMCGGGRYPGFSSYDQCVQEREQYNQCLENTQGVYGYHFQWGNNYGFKPCISMDGCDMFPNGEVTGTQIMAPIVYNPFYINPVFIVETSNWLSNSSINDLWGGTLDDEIGGTSWIITNSSDRQGPCPEGYHVPSAGELDKMNSMMGNDYNRIRDELLIPFAGSRSPYTSAVDVGTYAILRSSSPQYDDAERLRVGSTYHGISSDDRSFGMSIRCFKNLELVSISFYIDGELDKTQNILSGSHGETYNPQKQGYFFDGWYDNQEFEGEEFAFDTIVNRDVSLYAKWKAFEREDITICDPEDSGACITMMDRNLGATNFGIGCTQPNYYSCSRPGYLSEEFNYDYDYCTNHWLDACYANCFDGCECGIDSSAEEFCGGGYDLPLFDNDFEVCEQENEYLQDEYNECMKNNEGIYGYHYQRGGNRGFDSMSEDIPITKLRAVWDPSYNNYGYVGPDSFILGYYDEIFCDDDTGCYPDQIERDDYWENDEHYDGLRGGAEDSVENNWGYDAENHMATNVEGRQGPCPEGYHVPSIGEWNTVLDYWIKENKDPEKKIVNEDGLVAGYVEGYDRVCYQSSEYCRYDEYCIDESEYGDCYEYEQVEYCDPMEVSCDGEYDLYDIYYIYNANIGREFQESFYIPLAGYVDMDGYLTNLYSDANLWSSSPMIANGSARYFHIQWNDVNVHNDTRVQGNSIRCFKNVADIPNQQNTGSTTTGSTTEPTTGGGGNSGGGSHGGGSYGGGGGGAGGMVSNNEPTTQDPEIIAEPDVTVDGHNSAGEVGIDTTKFDTNYSDEMNEAYQYAYHYGITTKKSVKDANMGGYLTRIAMAKMLSQYAINTLGRVPDTSKSNKFTDVSEKMDSDYNDGVTLAYQLGIMGQNMSGNKFRPYDLVTRAEFVTALSRLLYNTKDGNDMYYSTHMNLLSDLGIITKTDPKMLELRGYVMIMLMRAK